MIEQTEIYNNLLNKYPQTKKIGPTKPYNLEHAKKIAHAAALSMYNRQFKKNNSTSTIQTMGTVQLKLI